MNIDQLSRVRDDSSQFPGAPPAVRPTASPVDTFTQPNAGAEMRQLATALSGLAPSLGRFSDIQFEREKGQAQEQATVAASKAHNQRLEYADAVKQGVIQPNQNPWFQFYFKQQSGALAAGDYGAALEGEMKTNPAWVESTDPNDFAKLKADFDKRWMKDNIGDKDKDLHFSSTFRKIADGVSADAAKQFASIAGAKMQLKAGDQLNQLLNQTIDRSYQKGESREALVAQLNAVKSRYLVDNPNGGTIANEQATRAIRDYALLHPEQAEDIFGLAKDIKAGSGNLDGVGIFREMEADTRTKIMIQRGEQLRVQGMEEEQQDKKGERDMWSGLVTELAQSKNPNTLDVSKYVTAAKQFGNADEVVRRIYSLRESLANKDAPGNDETFRRASLRVYGLDPEHPGNPLSMSQLAGMANLDPGLRLSANQFMELATKIQERDKASEEGRVLKEMNVLSNPAFVQAKQILDKGLYDQYDARATGPIYGLALEELTDNYLKALPQIEAANGIEARNKIIQGLAHDAIIKYAPESALISRTENEANARANTAKQSVFHSVIAKIQTPDDRRSMERIMSEVGDINERPLDADKKPRTLSRGTREFLFNHGMGTLFKPGQTIDMDMINEFLSEYRRANNLK